MGEEPDLEQPAPDDELLLGVFVSSGVDLRMNAFTITVDTRTGEADIPPVTFSTRFDTWDHWLIIAQQHLDQAEAALAKVHEVNAAGDENALGPALEEEFRHGMATIAAAATAVDAFYSAVQERRGKHNHYATWQANATARHKRISETLRWAWNLDRDSANLVKTAVNQLYKFRDPALHPPAEYRLMELRQDLRRYVEWRFSWYRARHARAALQDATGLIAMLLGRNAHDSLQDWVAHGRTLIKAVAGVEIGPADQSSSDAP